VPPDGQGRPALRIWCTDETRDSGPKPVVVFLHGGGLFSNATTYVPCLCPRFCRHCAESGKVCVEVDYPLSRLPWQLVVLMPGAVTVAAAVAAAATHGIARASLLILISAVWLLFGMWRTAYHGVRHPAHLKACAQALSWTRLNAQTYGGDPWTIVLWGHSAGGQLAALLAWSPSSLGWPLAGLVLLSAPLDYRQSTLAKLHPLARAVARTLLLQEPLGLDPSVWETASPLWFLESDSPLPLAAAQAAPALQEIPPLPLMLVEAGLEFVVPWVNRQAAHIFSPEAAVAAGRRRGFPTFHDCVSRADHFSALARCRRMLSGSHPFWQLAAERGASYKAAALSGSAAVDGGQ